MRINIKKKWDKQLKKIPKFILVAFPSHLNHPLQLDFSLHDLGKEVKSKYINIFLDFELAPRVIGIFQDSI